jgi:hypothetical protein
MTDAPNPAKGAVTIVLDAKIAKLKADIEKLKKEGGDPQKIAELQNLMRSNLIQRAKLG